MNTRIREIRGPLTLMAYYCCCYLLRHNEGLHPGTGKMRQSDNISYPIS